MIIYATALRLTCLAALPLLVSASACVGQISDPQHLNAGDGSVATLDATVVADTTTTFPDAASPDASVPVQASSLSCDPTVSAAVEPLKRLSVLTYRNALSTLFAGPVFAGVRADMEPALAQLPVDGDVDQTFGTMDDRVAEAHGDVYFAIANDVGLAVVATPEMRAALAGDCANDATLTDTCVRDFIADFGSRVLRRPLSGAEVDRYAQVAATGNPAATVISDLVFSFLMAPQFLYVVEHGADWSPGTADVVELTAHELAMRMSQLFWQSIPDAALVAAADDGSLLTEAGYAAQVERMANDPRTQPTVILFFEEWFRIVANRGFPDNPLFNAIDAGVDADASLYDAMRAEVQSMIDHFVWNTPGTYADLLTTTGVFTQDQRLAGLYGVNPWDGTGTPPDFPAGERSGMLTRAGLLLQSGRTNPILRGARIRKEILCDDIHPPSFLTSEDLAAPPLDPSLTTRERYHAKTSGDQCAHCHKLLNPIGFVLELYDGLGRYRTDEIVYDDTGAVIATLPIDPVGAPQLTFGDTTEVGDPASLMQGVADNAKTYDCFARHYFRFAFRRFEDFAKDGCTMTAVRDAVEKGSLSEALKSIALQPAFKLRTMDLQ